MDLVWPFFVQHIDSPDNNPDLPWEFSEANKKRLAQIQFLEIRVADYHFPIIVDWKHFNFDGTIQVNWVLGLNKFYDWIVKLWGNPIIARCWNQMPLLYFHNFKICILCTIVESSIGLRIIWEQIVIFFPFPCNVILFRILWNLSVLSLPEVFFCC